MSFVVERYPFALPAVRRALEPATCRAGHRSEVDRRHPATFCRALTRAWRDLRRHTTRHHARRDGFRAAAGRTRRARRRLRRLSDPRSHRRIADRDERREILRGMILTRALDNRLKQFFLSGEIKYRDVPFQGKGFRSLGQEAIYAAGIRLKRGERWRDPIAAGKGTSSVRSSATSASRSRCGPSPPRSEWSSTRRWPRPVRPWTAAICTSATGNGESCQQRRRCRSARCPLPASRWRSHAKTRDASRSRSLARAGRRSVSGTRRSTCAPRDVCRRSSASRTTRRRSRHPSRNSQRFESLLTKPPAMASPASRSMEPTRTRSRQRSRGRRIARELAAGPALIELVSMRMSGHAHHDDMLFLGKEPPIGWDYPKLSPVHTRMPACSRSGPRRIQSPLMRNDSKRPGSSSASDVDRFKQEALELVENEARAVIDAPWPEPADAGTRVYAGDSIQRASRSARTGVQACDRSESGSAA